MAGRTNDLWGGLYAGWGGRAFFLDEILTALANILRYELGKIKQDIEAIKKIIGE